MSKIKNGALDQYGAEPFEQQQFGTAGVEGVNSVRSRLLSMKLTEKSLHHLVSEIQVELSSITLL